MRGVPVVCEVDVVVVGGSLGGVAAAVAAAEAGSRVFLAAPRPYLGEDLCATLRLWLEPGEEPGGELTGKIFSAGRLATPMRVKKTLEEALLESGVQFLLECYVSEVLQDARGMPAGVVMANRAGRQAVISKVVIDATDRAWVARLAGAETRPWPRSRQIFKRVVLGHEAARDLAVSRQVPCPEPSSSDDLYYFEYELCLEARDTDYVSLAAAEQQARELTYREGQLRASESLFQVPPDPVVGQRREEEWTGLADPQIGHFRPQRLDRIYVLSGSADLPRDEAGKLVRPVAYEAIGHFVGQKAAEEAAGLSAPVGVRVRETPAQKPLPGEVREVLTGLRPTDEGLKTVPFEGLGPPVLTEVDVVVVGGGTAGAPAAIGAARQGARTLLIEYQEGLGGTGTLGLIGRPYHGKNIGFTREVPFPDKEHNVEHKMEWYRREVRKAGGDIWLGALGCGAVVEEGRVTGVVVVTPQGRGVVLAKVVVDATGNGDIAAAAGAESMYGGDGGDLAMQGAGVPSRPLGADYVNTDYLLVDESDLLDVWSARVGARQAMDENTYDVGPLIQTRERRRIVGDHVLSYLDQIAGRTYPDSIVVSESDYDSHGYPSEAYFALLPHDEESKRANHPAPGGTCYTPYRCLTPHGLDGILVAGIAISMRRDASAMMRMQRDIQNQGYAAGVAAAMAVEANASTRGLDLEALQEHLVRIGNLPEEVLTHTDSFPLPPDDIRDAVRALPKATNPQTAARPLAVILSHSDTARPMLREAYREAAGSSRLTFARVMGFLGEQEVVPDLMDALESVGEWDAKILQGAMAEYAHLPTPVDGLILALGHTGDRRGVPVILKKLATLEADVTLSHHRAVAVALERIGDPAAAEPLARLLAKPGMRGHAMAQLEPLHDKPVDKRRRTGSLREITLARALYRCGDHEGLGRQILEEYQHDLRGLFARHASAGLSPRASV